MLPEFSLPTTMNGMVGSLARSWHGTAILVSQSEHANIGTGARRSIGRWYRSGLGSDRSAARRPVSSLGGRLWDEGPGTRDAGRRKERWVAPGSSAFPR